MFKIDKAGFYKNRKGECVRLSNDEPTHGWYDNCGNWFNDLGKHDGGKFRSQQDIVAHWEAPRTENPSGAHGVQPFESSPHGTLNIDSLKKGWKGEPLELEEFKAIDESAPISKGQIGDFWEKVCEERVRNSNHINNKLKNKFYLVFNPSQSAPKYKHYKLEEAQKEAKRIAKRHPEQTVYVLETIACYTAEVEVKVIRI